MNDERCKECGHVGRDLFATCQSDQELMKYYTRFTPSAFEAIYESLLPIPIDDNAALICQRRQLFIMILKLTHNFGFRDLAVRFNISKKEVSAYFHQWINIVHDRLYSRAVFSPSRVSVQKNLPRCFREYSPMVRHIIDCFEIDAQMPQLATDQAANLSNDEQRTTNKVLIAIGPIGIITFVSNGFHGRVCDNQIVMESGFLQLVEKDDIVLADRGFSCEEQFAARGAILHTPALMSDRNRLPIAERIQTERLANVRIHVERVIGSVRNRFKILQGPVNTSFLNKYDDTMTVFDRIVKVCAILHNFLSSIVPLD